MVRHIIDSANKFQSWMKIELTILSWRLNLLQSQLLFVDFVTSIESVVMVRQRKWFVCKDVADLNKDSSIFFFKALFISTFMILNNSSLLKNISNNWPILLYSMQICQSIFSSYSLQPYEAVAAKKSFIIKKSFISDAWLHASLSLHNTILL